MNRSTPTHSYTAKTRTIGGREHGTSRSTDGQLDIVFSAPGDASFGTNPEQLLAAAWSACFRSTLDRVAEARAIVLPQGIVIEAEVVLRLVDGEYILDASFSFVMPGTPRDEARSLLEETHRRCAYSKATRGNIKVAIQLIGDV